jgi:hypothetical protein
MLVLGLAEKCERLARAKASRPLLPELTTATRAGIYSCRFNPSTENL